MKKKAPYIFGGLGVILCAISWFLRQGTPDADTVITNLASVFMVVGGAVCLLIALVTYLMRHQGPEW